jgi:hypothetical protein
LNIKKGIILFIIFLALICCIISCTEYEYSGTIFYVSSINGDDANNGKSSESAIKSIARLNEIDLEPADTVLFECGSVFREYIEPKSGNDSQKIIYDCYGSGEKPMFMGSVANSDISDVYLYDDDIYYTQFSYDVGNIIFNNNADFGIKKFSLDELTDDLDYFYNSDTTYLYIKADDELKKLINNQESTYSSVEFALTKNIIDLTGCHDISFQNISILYGSAHGFGGQNYHDIVIQNCSISYIGGGLLYYDSSNEPVRYGNGVELYNSGYNILVDNCEIFEIFDTAVTNQGNQDNAFQYNITYSNNVIYNCGMSAYELWLKGNNTSMHDISFVNNTVYDIGTGFSNTQIRENFEELGHFIIDFGSTADMYNIDISNNSFDTAINPNASVFLLILDIDNLEDNPIYTGTKDNIVTNVTYTVVYRKNGELIYIE